MHFTQVRRLGINVQNMYLTRRGAETLLMTVTPTPGTPAVPGAAVTEFESLLVFKCWRVAGGPGPAPEA